MHDLLVRLAYDGTDFHGCPPQPPLRTVGGEVLAALARAGEGGASIDMLSRTDAGVHATANVAVVRGLNHLQPAALSSVLQRQLPADLRCTGVAILPDGLGVVDKTYRYVLDRTPEGDPFLARYAWRPPGAMAAERLPELAERLIGRVDASGLARSGERRQELIRTVLEAGWSVSPGRAELRITGDGFTWRLVRTLVGAMVAVAGGGLSERAFVRALRGERNETARHQAPARGLRLDRISLAPEPVWRPPGDPVGDPGVR